jgi:predicted lipoprotein with Yx(FWY)xxD motif
MGLAILASVAVACSVGPGATQQPTVAPSVAPHATATAHASAVAYEVDVTSGSFGRYLTGEDGKALYVLTRDSAGTSTCTGQCATDWPPFTLENGETTVAGSGVSGTLATIQRPDGSTQVSLNGIPLYYFSGDTVTGDTNGQGFGGVWFLASSSGTPLSSAAPASSPASSGAPSSPGPSPSGYHYVNPY